MLRGINRATIFYDDEDYEAFLDILTRTAKEPPGNPQEGGCRAEIHLYCLMDNHLHLLLQEKGEALPTFMKRITVRFAAWYNRKYQRTGHLFQDRYRSEPVDDDPYFLVVYRYIAKNPVAAGLAEKPGQYRWCGYRANRLTVPSCLDITAEQLRDFVRSEQPPLHTFRERITDREAGAIIRKLAGVENPSEVARMGRDEQKRLFPLFFENNVTIQQIARVTGVPKSNVARYLG